MSTALSVRNVLVGLFASMTECSGGPTIFCDPCRS